MGFKIRFSVDSNANSVVIAYSPSSVQGGDTEAPLFVPLYFLSDKKLTVIREFWGNRWDGCFENECQTKGKRI
jgi:hypothetical protein